MKVEMSLVTLFKLLSSSLRFTLECTCMALVFPVVTIIAKKRQDGFYAWSERWTYPGFTGVVSFGLTRAPSFLLRYLWESLVNGDQCATCLIFTQFLSSPDIPCYWLSWGRKKMDEEDCMPLSLSNSTNHHVDRWCSSCNILIHQHVTVLQKSSHCVHTCMVMTTTFFCNSDLLDL